MHAGSCSRCNESSMHLCAAVHIRRNDADGFPRAHKIYEICNKCTAELILFLEGTDDKHTKGTPTL